MSRALHPKFCAATEYLKLGEPSQVVFRSVSFSVLTARRFRTAKGQNGTFSLPDLPGTEHGTARKITPFFVCFVF